MGSGEIPVGLADTDAVAPEGTTGPSWRASGLPFLSPRVYRGRPLAAASSSSRPFLEVLLGTGTSESRSLVGDLRWTQRSRGFVVFVDPPLSAFVSFLFSLSFLLGVFVLLPPQPLSSVVSVGCFVIQSGGKPFFVKKKAVGRWKTTREPLDEDPAIEKEVTNAGNHFKYLTFSRPLGF